MMANSSTGLMSFDFFLAFLSIASASALRLALSASLTASSRSISSSSPVDAFATVSMSLSFSVISDAGLQRLCLYESQRKSRIRRLLFPGNSLVPLPIIWQYRLRTLVGLKTTTQSHDGQSHPSVSNMALHRTAPGPALSNHSSVSFLSGLVPFTSLAPGIRSASSCAMLISGQNTTVFLALACVCIAFAICGRYGSSVAAMLPTSKSPIETLTDDMSISSGMVLAAISHR